MPCAPRYSKTPPELRWLLAAASRVSQPPAAGSLIRLLEAEVNLIIGKAERRYLTGSGNLSLLYPGPVFMARLFEQIDDTLAGWIRRQQMFFVASAPLAADGRINCSPKGLDTLRILGPTEIAYLDLGGSGIETVAHLKENSRIVVMFCAFEGGPRILRLHGRGTVIERDHPEFRTLLATFPPQPVCRNIIRIRLERISDSCGWGVPLYDYAGQRDEIERAVAGKTPDQLRAKAAKQNRHSIDGLEGLNIDALS